MGRRRIIRQGRIASVDTGDGEGMLLTHEFGGALLALASKIAVSEVVAVEATVRFVRRAIANDEGQVREVPNTDFDESKACSSGADGAVIRQFDLKELGIPIGLVLVAHHGEHVGVCVLVPLEAAVSNDSDWVPVANLSVPMSL